jgi:spore maturation protein A
MLNYIWFAMIILAILIAGGTDLYHELQKDRTAGSGEVQQPESLKRDLNETTRLGQVTTAALKAAGTAVEIAIGLIGVMALWLGIMKLAEEAGLNKSIARIVRPVTRLLFPSIPADHPAITAMIMNVAANMLGLSNAATPLGLKAMEELDKLNPQKGVATDDMCMFLVINTTAITLIPATAIAVRAAVGSANPQMIIFPSIAAASTATVVGIIIVKLIQRLKRKKTNIDSQALT